MRHEDLKIGMKVIANNDSNGLYTYTTEKNGCVGVVVSISDNEFTLRITENKLEKKIGSEYPVNAKYFDVVVEKGSTGMAIELKSVKSNLDFEYGDLLVFEKGKQVLVLSDMDGHDYRGVIIGEYKPTSYRGTKSGFIELLEEDERLGSLVRVIEAKHLKLSEI